MRHKIIPATAPPRIPTLYMSQKDFKRAIIIGIDILKNDRIKKDPEGFSSVDELCEMIKNSNKNLNYINRNHIIEFFFKDKNRKILISGLDRIKYKEIRYVKPPDILYFGTLEHLLPKMKVAGIRSNTKGYIKLYDTPEKAKNFAQKFIEKDDNVVTLTIDAKSAFSDGLKFSTFKEGEFIIIRVNKKYILRDHK